MSSIAITAIIILLCNVAGAQTRSVAITIDDLPVAGKANRFEVEVLNSALLKALEKHRAPATVFVNEHGIEDLGLEPGARLLRGWVDKGHDLGNHTYSHADLNKLTIAEFKKEVIRGEATIGNVLKAKRQPVKFFRFPFNHLGDTVEKRNGAVALLAKRGYKIATCTIDNSDYEFARTYQALLTKNEVALAAKLQKEYLAFTAAEIDYYSDLHQKVLGRQTPHVMLLHANKLNAETLDAILTLFEQRNFQFVTLAKAQADRAYDLPVNAVTAYGPMWGYRWAKQRGVKVNGALEPIPPSWILKYDAR